MMNTNTFWKNCALAHGLSNDETDLLETLGMRRHYEGGDSIIRQFERSTDLYIVIAGRVRVSSLAELDLAEGGEGYVFGELALLDQQPRSATVTACGATTVFVLSGDIVRKLMQDLPILGQKLMSNMSRLMGARLRAANMRILVS